jgi:putative heme-binding domain, Pirellula/Verrucomicrobium type
MRVLALIAGGSIVFASVRAAELQPSREEGVGVVKEMGSRVAEPEVAAASDEGRQALERMKLAPGLRATLWAAEPMLANPVAFNLDERGRVFVAETYRYRTSVLDIRDYLWMLEDDLAARTVEDRTALIRKNFGEAGEKELGIESELLRLVEDRDGDGVADFSTIYAGGFNSPLDGIASGVMIRRGEVWFTNIPSVWKFTGAEKAETREEVSRGYGVRFNYTGHDLHGLTWGPDGKIYFSVGDRGAHVPTKEGGVIEAADTGSVFRMNPDGTQLEVFATGLRNPQSLLFTENGDLFTGDNDSDQGDEERLVHLVEGGDSGWRIGWQFAPLGDAGPWNSEKMWHPRNDEQPGYMLPPICNIEDGPSGVAYYPGTGLNPSFQGAILITHFKGSISRSGIYDYRLKPKGASYEVAEAKPFLTSALPTDVRFGPDGKVYYSDWAEGWPKSKRGRIYTIFDPERLNDPLVQETKRIIASDFTRKSPEELVQLLGHADWRVRLEAQFTLAERGAESVSRFVQVLERSESTAYARRHATWGLGQLAGQHREAVGALRGLIGDRDAEVRAQAAKLLGDHRVAEAFDELVARLRDENARVRFFAAQSLGKLARPEATEPLLALVRENNDEDLYLRHAAVMGLAGSNNVPALVEAARSESSAVRMGALLALRRLGRAEIAVFLRDADYKIAREAVVAINDTPVEGAMEELAAMIEDPVEDAPRMLRVINANFRLGRPEHAAALAKYAARKDAPGKLRAEALAQLAAWPKPPARDRVVGVFRPLTTTTRDVAAARMAVEQAMPALFAAGSPEEVQLAALKAVEALDGHGAADTLVAVVRDSGQTPGARAAAFKALDDLKDARVNELVTFAGESDAPALRLAALPVAARISPEAAAPLLARLVREGTAEEQKAAYKALANSQHASTDALLKEQLARLEKGGVAPAAQLELIEAAAKRENAEIKRLVEERDARLATDADPLAPYRVALEGGNARAGERIFWSQPVMACVRCHTAGGGGGDAGPPLGNIGKRLTREQLLEAVVKPNATIAPGFDSVVVTLKSGGVVGGTVAEETSTDLRLRDADGKITVVKKAEIATREGAPSSMPEIYGVVLTKTELRDLIEFLAKLDRKQDDAELAEVPRALRKSL